jgi:hypothetical protein
MPEDPLGAVYAFVERAYFRLQASDVLTQCLDEGRVSPLHRMVESLVLAGPTSLSALREIQEELETRLTQLENDRRQVYSKLDEELKGYGVQLLGMHTPHSLSRLTPGVFLASLRQQGVEHEEAQLACLQHLQDALGLLKTLTRNESLLNDLDFYLQDWLWGVIYQTARGSEEKPSRIEHIL